MSAMSTSDVLSIMGWFAGYGRGPMPDVFENSDADILELLGRPRLLWNSNASFPDGYVNVADPEDRDQSNAEDYELALIGITPYRKTYRVGVRSDNAKGWGELGGTRWVFPEIDTAMFSVFDGSGRKIDLVMDEDDGTPYFLATKSTALYGSAGKYYKDKYVDSYDTGSEIPWTLRFREHLAAKEHAQINHLESHLYIRPMEEKNKNAAGYTKYGLREEQEINLRIYKDGNLYSDSETKKMSIRADAVFDEKIQANRIQLELRGTASEVIVNGCDTYYEQLDVRIPTEREMDEAIMQEEFSLPEFWLGPGNPELMDKATGNFQESGSVLYYSDGPDGDSTSALVFSPTSSLQYAWDKSLDDFSIIFSAKDVLSTRKIIEFSDGVSLSLFWSTDHPILIYADGSQVINIPTVWNGEDWGLFMITRSGPTMKFYFGESLLSTQVDVFMIPLSGDHVVVGADVSKRLFDIRIYANVISDIAFEYYCNNVIYEKGKAVLCQ